MRSYPLVGPACIAAVLAFQPQPSAIVDGSPIGLDDLAPALAEAAGAQVLSDAILDRLLAAELKARGIKVSQANLEEERRLAIMAMADEAHIDEVQAGRLLEDLRRERGLGPRRFGALLTRNASLRLLVRETVTVSPQEVRRALDLAFGAGVRARIIVARSAEEAGDAGNRARRAGGDNPALAALAGAFADEASRVSIDPSGVRGGLLGRVHPDDDRIPAGVRTALASMRPGEVSPPIGVEGGFAVVLHEGIVPAAGEPTPQDADRARERLRRRKERQAMDRLAASLVAGARVTVFDESLRWSWEGSVKGR